MSEGVSTADLKRLADPFPDESVEWRVQNYMADGHAIFVPYITARAVQDRLDAVCGPSNWWNDFLPGPAGGIMCGITIRTESGNVTKWDGSDNSDIEAVKGGFSDSAKRAAVQWGIGRYLYTVDMADCYIMTSATKGNHTERARVWDKSAGQSVTVYFTPPKPKGWTVGPDQINAAIDQTAAKLDQAMHDAKTGNGTMMDALKLKANTDRISRAEKMPAVVSDVSAVAIMKFVKHTTPEAARFVLDALESWAEQSEEKRKSAAGQEYLAKIFLMMPEISTARTADNAGTVGEVSEKYLTNNPGKGYELLEGLREKAGGLK